jgi:hypothetical protein
VERCVSDHAFRELLTVLYNSVDGFKMLSDADRASLNYHCGNAASFSDTDTRITRKRSAQVKDSRPDPSSPNPN